VEQALPERLPQTPADCMTLAQWRDLKLGMSQQKLAAAAGVKQARISEIERGHLPRRRYWPELLKAMHLEGFEADFYRMVMNAKRMNAEREALTKPISETEPLLATAHAHAPAAVERLGSPLPAQKAVLA